MKLDECKLNRIVKESVKMVLKEGSFKHDHKEEGYSVFFKDGDEANDEYLDKRQAFSLALNLEDDGYEVIVARLSPEGRWIKVYQTM